jgi:hypothetical protein
VGLFNKLQFWKKDEEFASSEPPSYDFGSDPLQHSDPLQSSDPMQPSAGEQPFAQQNYPQSTPFPGRQPSQPMQQPFSQPFAQQNYPQSQQNAFSPSPEHAEPPQSPIHPRDVELILAKLDAIKSEMDALHQRVRKIEQATETGKKYW